MKKKVLGLTMLLTSCAVLGGSEGENYQHLLVMLCRAPPNVMAPVLTTQELRVAWSFVCLHAESVPRTPVPQTQLQMARE